MDCIPVIAAGHKDCHRLRTLVGHSLADKLIVEGKRIIIIRMQLLVVAVPEHIVIIAVLVTHNPELVHNLQHLQHLLLVIAQNAGVDVENYIEDLVYHRTYQTLSLCLQRAINF